MIGGTRRWLAAHGPDRGVAGGDGFALIAVLLVLALLGVIGAEFAFSMRLEASMVRSYKEGVIAMHLAEAGVQQAMREVVTNWQYCGYPDDEPLTFFRAALDRLPRLPREAVPLGGGEFSYRISDEEARLDLNRLGPNQFDRIDRLLAELGLEKRERDTVVDSIQDWRDGNEEHRLNGAESDTYLELPVPYRSRNGAFEDIRELLQVQGVTAKLYYGDADHPALRDFVTVRGTGQVNINTAPEVVLRALGLSDAEISEIVQTRRVAPYGDRQVRFGQRGLSVTSNTFRIEAEGRLGGQPRARVTAIVQRRLSGDGDGTDVVVLGWYANEGAAPVSSAR
jgi:type II secretory pathway component PulK